jgi:hypothetical protein
MSTPTAAAAKSPETILSQLADEAQALLSREGDHLERVRTWLQRVVTDWSAADLAASLSEMEGSARQLAEQRRRFQQLLARGLGVVPAEARLSKLLERLPSPKRVPLGAARAHVLWLVRQVVQLMRLARMQSNDLASCLNTLLQGAEGGAGSGWGGSVVERYDGRGLKANTPRATFLNDRC